MLENYTSMMLTFSKEANYCVLCHIYCLLWRGNLKFWGDFQECDILLLPASLFHIYANRFGKTHRPTVNADNSVSKHLRGGRPCPPIHTITVSPSCFKTSICQSPVYSLL